MVLFGFVRTERIEFHLAWRRRYFFESILKSICNEFEFNLINAKNVAIDDAALMQEQMQMGGGASAGMGQDIAKVYKSERENLDLVQHEWDLENIEQRIIENFSLPKIALTDKKMQ